MKKDDILIKATRKIKVNRKEFLGHFEEIIEEEPRTLTGEEILKDQIDSIATLGLMAMVDELYNVKLSPNDIASCKTILDLMSLIEKKMEKKD